jgi:hypothetical protein
MRPVRPCLRLLCPRVAGLLGLVLLAGLAGCGPAPSDNASGLTSTAGASDFSAAHASSETGSNQTTSAAPLVVPAWMAKDLVSPEVSVRLRALDRWAQQAPTGAVDPLIQALEDHDAQVQARALELIVQDWARAQAARSEASP